MSVTLKVLNDNKVIAIHNASKDHRLIIQAEDNANYQLIDDDTGFAPQNIIVKHVGNNLYVFLEDGDVNADIIIEGYYNSGMLSTTNLLIGQHENGSLYAYVPESGQTSDAISMLAEQASAPQALGGDDLTDSLWTFNPEWLLALLPIAATASVLASSRHSDKDADSPILAEKEGAVSIRPGEDNVEVLIKYIAEDGTIKTAKLTKDEQGKWVSEDTNLVSESNNIFTLTADKIQDNSKLTAIGIDEKGNEEASSVNVGVGSAVATDSHLVTQQLSTVDDSHLITNIKLDSHSSDHFALSFPTVTEQGSTSHIAPTFSNGVTLNADGTLQIASDVHQFSISTALSSDSSSKGTISFGANDDSLTISNYLSNHYNIEMGSGNDKVIVESGFNTQINGGAGTDTLIIHSTDTINLDLIKQFEKIDLSDESAQKVKLSYSDLLDTQELFITGNSNDTVDLGMANTQASTATGHWVKGQTNVAVDSVTYDQYTYQNSSDVAHTETVYIQQGIMIV